MTDEQIARMSDYVREREKMRGLDPDIVHELHASPEGGYELRLSDIRAALALASQTCGNCGHFMPWDRKTMQGTGDCRHPTHRGKRNGQSPLDGCRIDWAPKHSGSGLVSISPRSDLRPANQGGGS